MTMTDPGIAAQQPVLEREETCRNIRSGYPVPGEGMRDIPLLYIRPEKCAYQRAVKISIGNHRFSHRCQFSEHENLYKFVCIKTK